jgi:hypothetical protein
VIPEKEASQNGSNMTCKILQFSLLRGDRGSGVVTTMTDCRFEGTVRRFDPKDLIHKLAKLAA